MRDYKKIKQVLDEVLAKKRYSDCIIRIAIMCQHFMAQRRVDMA